MKNMTFVKVLAAVSLSVVGLGMAGASSVRLDQTSGEAALSVVSGETLPYVTLSADSLGITTQGTVTGLLNVSAPADSGVTVSVNHARNEAGTLFVYLNISKEQTGAAINAATAITVSNPQTGASSDVNVQLDASAASNFDAN
ncbi:hypothetical protein [Deinococcus sp.]|uniref:hypothetical protein n=1 Tax=Deinococcus sp. TaxID=47478 RepID=UPI003CC59F2A